MPDLPTNHGETELDYSKEEKLREKLRELRYNLPPFGVRIYIDHFAESLPDWSMGYFVPLGEDPLALSAVYWYPRENQDMLEN